MSKIIYIVEHGEKHAGGSVVGAFKYYEAAVKFASTFKGAWGTNWEEQGDDTWHQKCDYTKVIPWTVDHTRPVIKKKFKTKAQQEFEAKSKAAGAPPDTVLAIPPEEFRTAPALIDDYLDNVASLEWKEVSWRRLYERDDD